MPGFDALYKQTVTLFNRVKGMYGEEILWYPTVLEGVHLFVDKSANWNSYGGQASDNTRLHVRYTLSDGGVFIRCKDPDGSDKPAFKPWYEPKAWRRLDRPHDALTFAFGSNDDFDFFVEGAFEEFDSPISDAAFERKGFYNYMNARYDNVFAVTSVSKYDLIPHFVITGR